MGFDERVAARERGPPTTTPPCDLQRRFQLLIRNGRLSKGLL